MVACADVSLKLFVRMVFTVVCGGEDVQICDSVGLLTVVPHALASVQVLVWLFASHALQSVQLQLSWYTVQLCDSAGLLSVVPQLFKSVTVLVCVPPKHDDQAPVSQFSTHTAEQLPSWLQVSVPLQPHCAQLFIRVPELQYCGLVDEQLP
jgi:hypothetical protein